VSSLLQATRAALAQVLSPPFRAVLWKSLGLTIALLLFIWVVLTRVFSVWLGSANLSESYPWLDAYAVLLAGFGLLVGLAYLIPAVSMLVAGFFLDDVAATVERESYPADLPGRPLPAGRALAEAGRFALSALGVNLLALLVIWIPGVNLVAFFWANGYLLGREYFSLAAGRFATTDEVKALRQRHSGTVLMAGFLIAALVTIPILNLLTPLFGTLLMVHLNKRLTGHSGNAILPPKR
jgi:CysZ protein